jgi:hypothetical protein
MKSIFIIVQAIIEIFQIVIKVNPKLWNWLRGGPLILDRLFPGRCFASPSNEIEKNEKPRWNKQLRCLWLLPMSFQQAAGT